MGEGVTVSVAPKIALAPSRQAARLGDAMAMSSTPESQLPVTKSGHVAPSPP